MRPAAPHPSKLIPHHLGRAFVAVAVAGTLAAGAVTAPAAASGASSSGGVTATTSATGNAKSKTKAKSKTHAKTKAKSKTHAKTKAKSKKRAKAKAQTSSTFVTDYTGPTGAIFHRRHTAAGPAEMLGANRYQEEAWFEIDGGRRARTLGTAGSIDANGTFVASGTTEQWSTPKFQVNLQRGTASSPTRPVSYARAGCPTQREAFRDTHGDLALWEYNRVKRIYDRHLAGEQLPAGPVIDGHETVTGEIRQSATFTQTMIIDRQTGALRRIVNRDSTGRETTLDYTIWEMIPAGGSAANLAGTLPKSGLEIRTGDCHTVAPFPAGTP